MPWGQKSNERCWEPAGTSGSCNSRSQEALPGRSGRRQATEQEEEREEEEEKEKEKEVQERLRSPQWGRRRIRRFFIQRVQLLRLKQFRYQQQELGQRVSSPSQEEIGGQTGLSLGPVVGSDRGEPGGTTRSGHLPGLSPGRNEGSFILSPPSRMIPSSRDGRELYLLAVTLDMLRMGQLDRVADALASRFLAIQQAVLDGHWGAARYLEIYGHRR